ncbi:universal stress protein [Parahaliea aestuarii]|uniref:Universal stress protein n=1 Tax=Parahaliea aestuarii TaxID=1852021 RepID=A0A5C8ZPV7_9GAMM|nr:universal stress protein [Parahaliea aestuarii]TXS89729.1 universal stress protein [Parahaliea aestuarii]
MKARITACIDGSVISSAVADAAAWSSRLLDAPVKLLHVLEKSISPATEDLSGAIGLGSREHLLAELTELDERRNKLAVEHGKHILEAARQRCSDHGATHVEVEQRHDHLLDALLECEADTRLYVVGRLGEDHSLEKQVIGSHIENVVRAIHTPILMATEPFHAPGNYMLAYDGSKTADAAIERISTSPLLANIPGHIVMVGDDSADHRQQLERVCGILSGQGHSVQPHLIQGKVIDALMAFQQEHGIELKVMGAYGHSRIREFLVGSNTSRMLAASTVPVLILR